MNLVKLLAYVLSEEAYKVLIKLIAAKSSLFFHIRLTLQRCGLPVFSAVIVLQKVRRPFQHLLESVLVWVIIVV